MKSLNERESTTLRLALEIKLSTLDELTRQLTGRLESFPFAHSSHFTDIMSDIDIRRETLLLSVNDENTRLLVLKNSAEMIERVEAVEARYWRHFACLKRKLMDVHSEGASFAAADELSDAKLAFYERKIVDLQTKLDNFRLLEYDLKQNRFDIESNASADSFGKLRLASRFVTSLNEEIVDVLVAHWNCDALDVWNMNVGARIQEMRGGSRREKCMSVWASEGCVCSGSVDHAIRVWDLKQGGGGECVRKLLGHAGEVNCLKMLAEDGRLASGSNDGTIRVWNLREGVCMCSMEDRSGYVFCLEQLGNGLLVSGSFDAKIRVRIFWFYFFIEKLDENTYS